MNLLLSRLNIASIFMATALTIGAYSPANADFFDFLFGPEPCGVGTKYTCEQLERAKYNVYFYTPEKREEYLGIAMNLASARIMSVSHANQLGLSRDSGWQTVFCLKTSNSECEEKH